MTIEERIIDAIENLSNNEPHLNLPRGTEGAYRSKI